MTYKVGNAFITVAPSFDKFQSTVNKWVRDNLSDEKIAAELKVTPKLINTTKFDSDIQRITRDRIVKVKLDIDNVVAENTLTKTARDRTARMRANAEKNAARQADVELDTVARTRTAVIDTRLTGADEAEVKLDTVARTRTAKVKVDVDRSGIGGVLGKTASFDPLSRGSIAGMFSQAGMAQAAITATPFLGPAALGGAAALGAGVVGSAGLVGVAASMIGSITQVVQAQKDLESSTKAQQVASLSLAAAQNSVITAQEGLSNSLYNVTIAERNVTQAQLAAKMAQEGLNDAREAAQRQLEGLSDSLKGAALAESGAQLAVEQATINLQKTMRDPRSTRLDVLLAEQALKEAKLQSSEASRSRKYAIEDAKDLRKEGVAGNSAVVTAKNNLARAQQGIADAHHQVAQANQAVADSQRALADATTQQAIAEQAMADATEAVATAQATLKPDAVQDFTKALQDLKDTFATFLSKTSVQVLGVAAEAMGVIGDILDKFSPATRKAAGALVDLLKQFSHFVRFHPLMQRFFDVMERFGPTFIKAFGNISMSLIRTFLRLFLDFAPLFETMAGGMVHLTRNFERWTWGLKGTDMFKSFISFIKDNGPVVLSILGSLATIGFKLIQALAPVAADLLKLFLPAVQWLAKQDPDLLLGIAAGITALINPYVGLGLALGTAWAFAKKLYDSNDDFHQWVEDTKKDVREFGDAVDDGMGDSADAAEDSAARTGSAWDDVGVKLGETTTSIKGMFTGLGEFMRSIGRRFSQLFSTIGFDISDFVAGYFEDFLGFLDDVFKATGKAFEIFADLINLEWSDLWKDLKSGAEDGAGLVDGALTWAFGDWYTGFKWFVTTVISLMGRFGTALANEFKSAINITIGVLNLLIKAINWLKNNTIGSFIADIPTIPFLAKGSSGSSTPTTPHHMGGFDVGMAGGGVLPGYTPGRDVHEFRSATGGVLHLSGGEAIMRPEWTRAVGGAGAVARMNAASRHFAGGGLYSPLSSYTLTQGLHDQSTGFPALDLGAPSGTPVHAVAPGRVTISKDLVGYEPRIASQNGYYSYGKYIQIAHPGGFSSLAAHLAARLASVGSTVAGGQIIGFTGMTGHTYGPHLHQGAQGISPYAFLQGSRDYPTGPGSFGVNVGPNVAGQALGAVGNLLSNLNPLTYLKNKLEGFWDGAGEWINSPVGKILKAIPLWLLKKIVPTIFGGITGAAGDAAGYVAGKISGPLNGPQQAQSYAQQQLSSFGWDLSQFIPLVSLWNRESGWRWDALNPSSGAYGIPQSLPASKMAAAGADWRTNPATQIMWGLRYIKDRYGSPSGAWAHSEATGWYDHGGMANGVGFWGKNTLEPERILSPQTTKDFNRLVTVLDRGTSGGRIPFVITNWHEGSGWMSAAADQQIAQDRAFQRSLSYMGEG